MLSARLPLTKTFVMSGQALTVSPYPHVSKVTSHHETATTLSEFKDVLEAHALKNHCLFNGQLDRPLENESRAGHTKRQARDWVVFDFDKVEGANAEEVIKTYLPAECQNVSYIVQLSASMYRPDVKSWSGHIFMLLEEPIEQQRLKQWFEYLNFHVPALTTQIELSDSLEALHWPLDRTVAYDSKLIYIAPPKCVGFKHNVKDHIKLVKKKREKLLIAPFNPIDNVTVRQKINELRRAIGETEVQYELTTYEGHEMLRNANPSPIQNPRTSGDHYIRFNLNGGDSYAYFIDLRNPEVIGNFKGEPYMLTKQVDETYYKTLKRIAPHATSKTPLNDGTEILAFYATNQSSKIKIGQFDPVERRVELHTSNESAARAWMHEYGLAQKSYLPHYSLLFDPTSDVQFMHGNTVINTFRITDYMATSPKTGTPSMLEELPPLTNKIIRSILGNPEDHVVTHFINWLAHVFQTRTKTKTAWVLNGVEGSGKGTFIEWVLKPLFGAEHVAQVTYANLNKEYNQFLENALFVVIEEADIRGVDNAEDVMSKVKNWIADDTITIRKMNTDHFNATNYSNFILNTNGRTPANISGTDRRFNFGERQDQRWYPTVNELDIAHNGRELEAFADVLKRWPVDAYAASMVIDTEAKRDAHEATTTINQQIADAVIKGDLQFFIDRTPTDVEAQADFTNRFATISLFKQKLDLYVDHARRNQQITLKDDDLFILFRTLIPDSKYFQDSTTWRRRHYKSLGLDVTKQHRDGGDRTRGVRVEWQLPTDLPAEMQQAEDKVTSIKSRRAKK